jgi:hypothetical protein
MKPIGDHHLYEPPHNISSFTHGHIGVMTGDGTMQVSEGRAAEKKKKDG